MKSFVGIRSNVADTASVSSSKSNESTFSPWGSPWVLDSPWSISNTDKENSVVEGGLAVVEDTALVWWPVGGINSDWNRSSGKGSGESGAVLNISESWNFEGTSILGAGLLNSLVWILIFVENTVSFNVLESIIHKTAIAGLVSEWTRAVNKLLFREALKFTSRNFGKTFKSSSSRESPAWSAWSLILDGGNCTLSGPINVSNWDVSFNRFDGSSGGGGNESEELLDEFFLSVGGELIDSHIVSSVLIGVVSVNLSEVFNEDSFSIGVLKLWGEWDSVTDFPALELRDLGGGLVVKEDGSGTNNSEQNCDLLSVHLIDYE